MRAGPAQLGHRGGTEGGLVHKELSPHSLPLLLTLPSLSHTHTHTSATIRICRGAWAKRNPSCLAQGDKPVIVCHTTGYCAECDSLLEGWDGFP